MPNCMAIGKVGAYWRFVEFQLSSWWYYITESQNYPHFLTPSFAYFTNMLTITQFILQCNAQNLECFSEWISFPSMLRVFSLMAAWSFCGLGLITRAWYLFILVWSRFSLYHTEARSVSFFKLYFGRNECVPLMYIFDDLSRTWTANHSWFGKITHFERFHKSGPNGNPWVGVL